MQVGIDKINFFVPPYYVDMSELAIAREVDPNKFLIGIGQSQMAIAPKTQDIITFAANAAATILTEKEQQTIDTVIVGTESGLDQSKASAVVLHHLLGIQPYARSFEIKEACYGATAGLQYAIDHVTSHPKSKVLVIASDNARYGLNSGGEPTQGAGAVAMVISANPRILAFAKDNVALTQDIYDFWRPNGQRYPLVDGQLSNETYSQSFQQVWSEYARRTGKNLADFRAIAFHVPYTKMGKKALMPELEKYDPTVQKNLLERYEESVIYSRRIGNLYTGSLYLGLISLLENSKSLKAGDSLGFFSYGSGAVAEFFSGILVAGYQEQLNQKAHYELLETRQKLTIDQYEAMFVDDLDLSENQTYEDSLNYSLCKVDHFVRTYRMNA